MKTIYSIIAGLLMTASVWAQAPEKMSYQAVIRNSGGTLVANTQIGMEINIRQTSTSGAIVYTEVQTPTTNANGLVSIEIGGGSGFSAIDWAIGTYYIETNTAIVAPLTTYTITGVSQLLSVPYALHSKTADNGITTAQANEIAANTAKVGITTQQASDITANNAKVGITTAQTTKLGGIADGAEVNVQADWNQATTTADDYIKNKPTIPTAANGSETKVTAGTNVTVTGTGTTASPYVVNATGGSSGFTHYIGELFGGGIVVAVWKESGVEKGLIASLTDVSASALYSSITGTLIGATAQSPIDGQANTTAIVAQGDESGAAHLCNNYSSGGFTNWYLPAAWELNQCYNAAFVVNTILGATNGFQFAYYWSSTEIFNNGAWYQGFVNGDTGSNFKGNNCRVRAVRRF